MDRNLGGNFLKGSQIFCRKASHCPPGRFCLGRRESWLVLFRFPVLLAFQFTIIFLQNRSPIAPESRQDNPLGIKYPDHVPVSGLGFLC